MNHYHPPHTVVEDYRRTIAERLEEMAAERDIDRLAEAVTAVVEYLTVNESGSLGHLADAVDKRLRPQLRAALAAAIAAGAVRCHRHIYRLTRPAVDACTSAK